MLKRLDERRHHCLTPTNALNQKGAVSPTIFSMYFLLELNLSFLAFHEALIVLQ